MLLFGMLILLLFQSTLPREERQLQEQKRTAMVDFNPRSHERSDVQTHGHIQLLHYFNPRSHERSDLDIPYLFDLCLYFNPRSHERSDFTIIEVVPVFKISIHAPTRGATDTDHNSNYSGNRFQSTLPREERRLFLMQINL